MKPLLVPAICSLALASMLGLVGRHWWTVREQVAAFYKVRPAMVQQAVPVSPPPSAIENPANSPEIPATQNAAEKPDASLAKSSPAPEPFKPSRGESEFYEMLIQKLKTLEHQNNELRDQIAETNRGQMELEFRFDTLSTSFHPLRVMEEPATTLDTHDTQEDQNESASVLPPRAILPVDELPRK